MCSHFNRFNVFVENCPSQQKGQLKTKKGNGGVGTCVFPFTYKTTTYTTCGDMESYGGVGWCAWDDIYKSGRWGYCTSSCPVGNSSCLSIFIVPYLYIYIIIINMTTLSICVVH